MLEMSYLWLWQRFTLYGMKGEVYNSINHLSLWSFSYIDCRVASNRFFLEKPLRPMEVKKQMLTINKLTTMRGGNETTLVNSYEYYINLSMLYVIEFWTVCQCLELLYTLDMKLNLLNGRESYALLCACIITRLQRTFVLR